MNRKTVCGLLLAATLALVSACGGTTSLNAPQTNGPSNGIVIGTSNFTESEILGYLYADVLKPTGTPVTVKPNLGSREVVLPALQHGDIDLLPEYQGSLLLYLDQNATQTTPEDLQNALAAKLPGGLSVLPYASAEDKDVFAVTKQTADKYGLHSLADLHKVSGQLVFGGPAEDKNRTVGLLGLQSVYGVTFKDFKALDADGPLVKGALEKGDVDVANLFSTDSDIQQKGWVVLDDPKQLVPAQHVAPVINKTKVTDQVRAALAKLNEKLTTEELSKLDDGVDTQHQDPDQVAADWIKANHIA
jgi:osmoprotectant transport system substrate-binding protein